MPYCKIALIANLELYRDYIADYLAAQNDWF